VANAHQRRAREGQHPDVVARAAFLEESTMNKQLTVTECVNSSVSITYKIPDVRAYERLVDEANAQKDVAYRERNQCVAALAKLAQQLGYRVGVAEHDPADKSWDSAWRTIVFIDFPTGQASWHVHDNERSLFADLPPYDGVWDGHSTPEKYRRLKRLGHA
jgi:hypothetical protein